ncbi:hypothetical protein HYV31_01850 [candidate division WWE3 bacterium]|nr:hypothetical protein [candidate division WWE3 bacterium]
MQNKKRLLIGLVLLLLIAIFFTYKAIEKYVIDQLTYNQDNTVEQKLSEESNLKGSIFDIIKLNKTLKCTFSTEVDGTKMSGTTYISGKNVRYVSELVNTDNTKIASNMITDGEWVYTWTSEAPQGIKMKMDSFTQTDSTADQTKTNDKNTGESYKNLNTAFDYKCINWVGDTKMFELPTNIEFFDFSSTLKGLMPTSSNSKPDNTGSTGQDTTKDTSGQSSMCAACEYASSAEDKAQCKTQFGCK